MNLNITPIDKIADELSAIDSFLNVTMSEEVEEAVQRGNDLAVYIARSGKLLADAKYHYREKMSGEGIKMVEQLARQAKTPAKAINALIDSLCREEQYLIDWCERVNRSATHQLEWSRTLISKAKAEMALAPTSYNTKY